MIKVKFYHDPGHGWYAVKTKEVEALGILEQITSCSYQSQSGKTLYLEEDCDASLLFKICKEKNIEVKVVKETYHDNSSPIRKYPNFMPLNKKATA